jgi:hypothetical protein
MIKQFAEWCGRNIEVIIWINVGLLIVSAVDRAQLGIWYPAGLCVVLVATILILRK